MSDNQAFNEMMQALNGHEITDENGEVVESETTTEEHQLEEQTTEDESAKSVETTADEEEVSTEDTETESENDMAEDDSGKKYVPENRFKSVYGKMKDLERKVAQFEQNTEQGRQLLEQASAKSSKGKQSADIKIDKADILELKMALPQFNPDSPDYSPKLDNLGFQILRANPGISPLEAGRKAIAMAKEFASGSIQAQNEARTVKASQSDQGITTRVTSRQATQPNLNDMSDRELEAYMKQNGMW